MGAARAGATLACIAVRSSIVAASALAALALALPGQAATGKRYTVNGHSLYMVCAGKGAPTVVLDAGLGDSTAAWRAVQAQAAQIGVRVCAYDRYGTGKSGWSNRTRPLAAAASDLHALVRVAKLARPIVLVGHSMGGLVDRYYAKLHPGDVSALVLLDSAPDTWDQYVGLRVFPGGGESLDVAAASASLRQVDSLGAKPVVVVKAENPDGPLSWIKAHTMNKPFADFAGYWDAAQRGLAEISSNSLFVVAKGSDHEIPGSAPNLVVASIRLVIASARTAEPLPACAASGLEAAGGRCD